MASQSGPMLGADGPEWLETDERVLWNGKPAVTPRLRRRLWGTGLLYLVILGLIVPLATRSFLGFDLPFFIAAVAIMGVSIATYVPFYCRRLVRTRYVLTSKRAVVIEEFAGREDHLVWAPLAAKQVKVRGRHSGSVVIDWGRSEGRRGKTSPAVQVAQALGFLNRDNKEVVLFVEVDRPEVVFSAMRWGRAELGLPPDTD